LSLASLTPRRFELSRDHLQQSIVLASAAFPRTWRACHRAKVLLAQPSEQSKTSHFPPRDCEGAESDTWSKPNWSRNLGPPVRADLQVLLLLLGPRIDRVRGEEVGRVDHRHTGKPRCIRMQCEPSDRFRRFLGPARRKAGADLVGLFPPSRL